MKIENLKIFKTVAQTGSINKTAELFFTTSQNISYIIKNMEKEMDVTLFFRDNKGMHLTDAGNDFLEIILPFLEQYDAFLVEQRPNDSDFVLQIYTTQMLSKCILSMSELFYTEQYYISMQNRNIQEMLTMLSQNKPGIYLIPVVTDAERQIVLQKEHIVLSHDYQVLLCHQSNSLILEDKNSIEQLKKVPMLCSSYYYQNKEKRIFLNIDDIETCKNYMREKGFFYNTTLFIYEKNFTEQDEWCILQEYREKEIAYYLVFNLPKKRNEASKRFLVRLLSKIFAIK